MQLTSRDRSMTLSIITPALGFTVSLDGHVWLFDSRLEITGCLAPPFGHTSPAQAARIFRFAHTALSDIRRTTKDIMLIHRTCYNDAQ